jgi:hypothetical protein
MVFSGPLTPACLQSMRSSIQMLLCSRPKDRLTSARRSTTLEHVVLVADVVAEVAVRLLDPARVERMHPAEREAVAAGLGQSIEDGQRHLSGHVEFPAELAYIRDAVRAHARHAQVDGPRAAEREGLVAEIGRRDAREQGGFPGP